MRKFRSFDRVTLHFFVAVLTAFLAVQSISAQNQTHSGDRGFTPGKSYDISGIETVAMQSGNLMLNVPLGALPAGRGGMSAGVGLHYNSKLWDAKDGEVPNQQGVDMPATSLDVNTKDGGWRYRYKHQIEYDSSSTFSGFGSQIYSFLVMPDGSRHALWSVGHMLDGEGAMNMRPDGTTPESGTLQWSHVATGTVVLYTIDGTYLRVEVTTDNDGDYANNKWTVYSPDGSRVVHNPGVGGGVVERVYDRNNNFVDVVENASDPNYSNRKTTYIRDEIGRKVVIEYNAATNGGMSQDFIHSPGFNGVDVVTKVEWKTIIVKKYYQKAGFSTSWRDYQNMRIYQPFPVVNKIYIPTPAGNGFNYDLSYGFDYNADATSDPSVGWGEVSQVTLPSGAKSSYQYQLDNVTENQIAYFIVANRPVKKTLEYNLEYDGNVASTSEIWNYAIQYHENNMEIPTSSTITGPDGGVTREEYRRFSNGSGYETETAKNVSADGTEIERYYQSNVPTEPTYLSVKANRFVKYEYTSIRDGGGNLAKTAIKEYSRDKNGNVTQVKEYDWVSYASVPRDAEGRPNGLPSGIAPARVTKTDYYNDTPDSTSGDYTDADSYYLASSPRLLSLAKSVEVQNGSGTPKSRSEMAYDFTNYAESNTKGGNLTETRSWDSTKQLPLQSSDNNGLKLTSANFVNTLTQYDAYGNPVETTNANGVKTNVIYGNVTAPSGVISGLYPTQVEIASNYASIKKTSTAVYDFSTGLITSTTDVDNSLTNDTEYDALGRPTKMKTAVDTAFEAWSVTEYYDQYRYVVMRSDLEIKGDGKKVATQFFDQLGRVRLSKTLEYPATQSATNETDGIKMQTRYKTAIGYSYQLTSNPYKADYSNNAINETTMGWMRTTSYTNGKRSEVETFAGTVLPAPWGTNGSSTGVVKTDRDADRTLVTDQAGKRRVSKTNALGQLINVWEIKASDGETEVLSFATSSGNLSLNGLKTGYGYDTLNNLTNINQGGQTRSFSYSSLSRLLSASNPESGTISYQYYDNGTLKKKTDARTVETNYFYDALNRVTSRTYSDSTPPVTYTYDAVVGNTSAPYAKGKLTKVSSSVSETRYTSFDALGRALSSEQRTTAAQLSGTEPAYASSYKYNLAGELVEQTYPSTRVVKNVLDANGDLEIVQSKKNTNAGFWNYAKSFTYNAAGAVSSMQLGNGHWESTQFNSRLQPTQIALGSVRNSTNLLQIDYAYNTVTNNAANADNNSNILSQTIVVPTETRNGTTYSGFTATQNYSYDELNRIHDAKETIGASEQWKQTYKYDRYGNRTFDEALTTTLPKNCGGQVCSAEVPLVNPTINTTTNKNQLNGYGYDVAGNTTKDAQNRKFTYDAENKQTKVETVDINNQVTGLIGQYWYDGDGRRVRKYVSENNQWTETIFVYDAFGKLVAEYSTQVVAQPNATVSYLTTDNLGSPRINTDQNGAVNARHDYQPFGEEIQRVSYGTDLNRKQFTSYERDKEVDLDFAQNRYYNFSHGRFTTVDPLMASADVINPQTLNRYIYVGNNPVNFTDPLGLIWGQLNGTVEWFANEAAMKAKGFTQYTLLYAYRAGTNQLVALNARTGAAIDVASATAWLDRQIAWRATPALLGESAAALAGGAAAGITASMAMLALADYIDPAGRWRTGMNKPVDVREFAGTQKSYWDEFLGALSKAKNNEATPPSINAQGETTPANPDPEDPNKPSLKPAHALIESKLDRIRKWSTEKIIDSLKPGEPEALQVYPDGVIAQGNHRIQVLRERGINVDNLPREPRERASYPEPGVRKKQ